MVDTVKLDPLHDVRASGTGKLEQVLGRSRSAFSRVQCRLVALILRSASVAYKLKRLRLPKSTAVNPHLVHQSDKRNAFS